MTNPRRDAKAQPDRQRENLPKLPQVVFGEHVRAARRKAKMTQADLSAKAGVAQQDISNIELGKVNLTIDTMTRLATALGATVGKMLQPVKDPKLK